MYTSCQWKCAFVKEKVHKCPHIHKVTATLYHIHAHPYISSAYRASVSPPDNCDPNPGPLLPSPRGSELELGLDFGLSTNTEEEAESLRKVVLTGDPRLGDPVNESLSRSCTSGIFCGEEGGKRKPMPSVELPYVSEYREPPGLYRLSSRSLCSAAAEYVLRDRTEPLRYRPPDTGKPKGSAMVARDWVEAILRRPSCIKL